MYTEDKEISIERDMIGFFFLLLLCVAKRDRERAKPKSSVLFLVPGTNATEEKNSFLSVKIQLHIYTHMQAS